MSDISFLLHVCDSWCFRFSYLVVQVPGLIVLFCAFPVIDGLVVYLDELPFRAVAEVSKKAAEANNELVKNAKMTCLLSMTIMWFQFINILRFKEVKLTNISRRKQRLKKSLKDQSINLWITNRWYLSWGVGSLIFRGHEPKMLETTELKHYIWRWNQTWAYSKCH